MDIISKVKNGAGEGNSFVLWRRTLCLLLGKSGNALNL